MGVWAITPRRSIEAECARRGLSVVVSGCVDILEGRPADDRFHQVLAGPAAEPILKGQSGGLDGYWPRVWAMRGLVYAWEDRALGVVRRGTTDDSWRVREMALKVIARHRLGDALDAAVGLRDDQVRRVRIAADRTLRVLVSEHA